MVVGHVALALAAKRRAPEVSLAWLVAAVLCLDILWPLFVLGGQENFVIIPDGTGFKRLAFTWYPWSHSLLMTAVWSVLAAGTAMAVGAKKETALLIGALVASHWVLDWVTHAPDLPLRPGLEPVRVGLDLWSSTLWTFVVETSLFVAGIWLYLGVTRATDRIGTFALWGFLATFTFVWATVPFSPPPPSEGMIAWTGALGMPVFVAWAGWADRHRARVA
jgi:hypothetical protein